MAKTRIVHDPYRNIETTLREFARAEGVPKHTASHYYWWHKSLEGFRQRPAQGTGNGIKPHTYTYKGVYKPLADAIRISGMTEGALRKVRTEHGGINDLEEIRRIYDAETNSKLQAKLIQTLDGRKVSVSEYAKEHHTTVNAVRCWISRYGTIKGFENRLHSRSNPKLYPHSGMGISKSVREWVKYFNSNIDSIKSWLYAHGYDMKGFEKRRKWTRQFSSRNLMLTRRGKTRQFKQWVQILGVTRESLYQYYRRHGNIENYKPRRKSGRPPKAD